MIFLSKVLKKLQGELQRVSLLFQMYLYYNLYQKNVIGYNILLKYILVDDNGTGFSVMAGNLNKFINN